MLDHLAHAPLSQADDLFSANVTRHGQAAAIVVRGERAALSPDSRADVKAEIAELTAKG